LFIIFEVLEKVKILTLCLCLIAILPVPKVSRHGSYEMFLKWFPLGVNLTAVRYANVVALMDVFYTEESARDTDKEKDKESLQKIAEEIKKSRETRLNVVIGKKDDKK